MKLVSAIMPTRGRQKWAAQALTCFLDQTYPAKELLILDDDDDPSFPDPPDMDDVGYFRSPGRVSISTKRNACCEMSSAEIIFHLDSDDWSAPTRIEDQVRLIEESKKAVAGFHSMLFYVEPLGQCFKYFNDRSFALGTSLCYLRTFWQQHRFRPDPTALPNVGEDTMFVRDARQAGELISVDAGQLMVARIHDANTSPKRLDGAQTSYRPVSRDALPQGFFQ